MSIPFAKENRAQREEAGAGSWPDRALKPQVLDPAGSLGWGNKHKTLKMEILKIKPGTTDTNTKV